MRPPLGRRQGWELKDIISLKHLKSPKTPWGKDDRHCRRADRSLCPLLCRGPCPLAILIPSFSLIGRLCLTSSCGQACGFFLLPRSPSRPPFTTPCQPQSTASADPAASSGRAGEATATACSSHQLQRVDNPGRTQRRERGVSLQPTVWRAASSAHHSQAAQVCRRGLWGEDGAVTTAPPPNSAWGAPASPVAGLLFGTVERTQGPRLFEG